MPLIRHHLDIINDPLTRSPATLESRMWRAAMRATLAELDRRGFQHDVTWRGNSGDKALPAPFLPYWRGLPIEELIAFLGWLQANSRDL